GCRGLRILRARRCCRRSAILIRDLEEQSSLRQHKPVTSLALPPVQVSKASSIPLYKVLRCRQSGSALRIDGCSHLMLTGEFPASTTLLDAQSVAGSEMPSEHLASPRAFETDWNSTGRCWARWGRQTAVCCSVSARPTFSH